MGADVNSDHDLVMTTMKLKLKQNFRSHGSRLKFNRVKLKDPEVADLFKATIGGTFAAVSLLEENIGNLTETIYGALVNTASEVLGKARKRKKPWMTNDIPDLCDRRRSLRNIRKEGH